MLQTDIPITIGKNIRHHRHLAGLSLKAVGTHLGITYQQMQKYETGANDISCEKMLRLAALFHCSIGDLCAGVTDNLTAETLASKPNSQRVAFLVSHFLRITSPALQDKLCRLVQAMADAAASGSQEGM